MRTKNVLLLSVAGMLLIIISIIWIVAYNGEVKKSNEIENMRDDVRAVLNVRYEKVLTLINSIESANTTVLGYLETIRDARTAFANAIDMDGTIDAASEIDGTLFTLLSYMEDNPSSYNTVGLYSGFASEFSRDSNVALNLMMAYNKAVRSYNNHIKTYPNFLFFMSYDKKIGYVVDNYNTELPTFH